ncbi:MAG: hypothetical protein EOP48_31760 [Sphingobacteriales bacterium]|nr:MAG: hypothetical protein EOP48_31760 [Sphingobacteriales bacterium]
MAPLELVVHIAEKQSPSAGHFVNIHKDIYQLGYSSGNRKKVETNRQTDCDEEIATEGELLASSNHCQPVLKTWHLHSTKVILRF